MISLIENARINTIGGKNIMSKLQTISTDDLQRRLQKDGSFQFWNVLTDKYFKGEMIPGSRRVPLDQVGREVLRAQIPKDVEIIVYCAGPSCPQSILAAEKLNNLEYTDVKAYEGGIEEWKSAGNQVEQLRAA
jgi:rhodanese-related sulfurtransferase